MKQRHQPKRGDAVEAWIKSKRDQHMIETPHWETLDNLLDDYRLHADTGQALSSEEK